MYNKQMNLTKCSKRALGWAKNESKFIYGVAEHFSPSSPRFDSWHFPKNYLGKINWILQRFIEGPAYRQVDRSLIMSIEPLQYWLVVSQYYKKSLCREQRNLVPPSVVSVRWQKLSSIRQKNIVVLKMSWIKISKQLEALLRF